MTNDNVKQCLVCLNDCPSNEIDDYDGNLVCDDCVEYLAVLSDEIEGIASETETITNSST